ERAGFERPVPRGHTRFRARGQPPERRCLTACGTRDSHPQKHGKPQPLKGGPAPQLEAPKAPQDCPAAHWASVEQAPFAVLTSAHTRPPPPQWVTQTPFPQEPQASPSIKHVGACTAAVIWRPLLGMLKPAGVPTVRTLMPAAGGRKAVPRLKLSPEVKTAGLPTIVPTDVVALVTATCTASPTATVPSAVTVAIDVALLGTLTVTAVGLGGAASTKICTATCKSLPTVIGLGDAPRPGALTVAVIWRPLLGVLKPAGTPTVRILMPAATGWKAVLELELSPGLKTAGLPTIVPTEVVPLVTGTFTVSPPRTA